LPSAVCQLSPSK
jgi:hypothetical protein